MLLSPDEGQVRDSLGRACGFSSSAMAQCLPKFKLKLLNSLRRFDVKNKFLLSFAVAVLAATGAGCSNADTANTNANANANAVATTTTRPGPDGSEITTSVDANGVRTETRVFHNNPRVSKVVVTTRDGRRTTTVYAPSGESKDLKDSAGDVLSATGDTIADGVGWTADKAEDVAGETKDAAKTIGDKTVDGAKTVGEKTADGARTVGEKTASGAKTVADKTASGAKKTGSAIKKAITP
jgi:hypothetical protein